MATFELPITGNENSKVLSKEVVNDLELVASCKEILRPTTSFGEKTVCLWATNYTPDVGYLNDTQTLLARPMPNINEDVAAINGVWANVNTMSGEKETSQKETSQKEEDLGFHAKYQYVDWDLLRPLNNNAVSSKLKSRQRCLEQRGGEGHIQ